MLPREQRMPVAHGSKCPTRAVAVLCTGEALRRCRQEEIRGEAAVRLILVHTSC